MSLDVSLVLVGHHSSALLPAAVEAFRRQARAAGLTHEVVLVEHSEDAAESERAAAAAAPDQLLVRANRGYAAGVNAGIAAARGRWLLVGNPDVELHDGALAALVDALGGGWDVVAPQLELAGFLFPPAEVQTPAAEAARRLASRSRVAWERHLRRELRRSRVVWDAAEAREVPALSGALLAFPAVLASRLGPWDEGYFLYFEETDWLRRARRADARLAVVPRARAAHRWGHAALPEEWTERFAASRERYYRRWFPLRSRALSRLRPRSAPTQLPWSAAPVDGGAHRWLLSPSPAAFPAALLEPGIPVDEAAAAFCHACRRPAVTLIAWHPADDRFDGPFAWIAGSGAAPG